MIHRFSSPNERESKKQQVKWTKNISSGRSQPPHHPTRRDFIKGAAVVGGLTLVGVAIKAEVDAQEEAPYKGWEKYQNKGFPLSLILQIGQNIEGSDYPGFSEVGRIIQRSQTDFASFDQFYPRLTKPIEVGLADLVGQEGSIAHFNNDVQGIGVEVTLKDKKTGNIQKTVLVDPSNIAFSQVGLENSIYLGSSTAKKILLVKEFSHLLYMNKLKDMLFNEITGRFDITTSAKAPLADLLVTNAYLYGNPRKPSPFGSNYDNGGKLLDYAGYWHIMPAMGVAIERGALPVQDLGVMYSDKNSFDQAIRSGLLTKQSKGNFVWKEGIGPFSKEWSDVMKTTF